MFEWTALIAPVIVASAMFVYWDASRNKIGRIDNAKHFTNASAGGWSLLTLLFWLFCFPIYLYKRDALVKLARDHPVEPSNRFFKMACYAILLVGYIWAALAGLLTAPLPACSSPDAKTLLGQILVQSAAKTGIELVDPRDLQETRHDEAARIRFCTGTVSLAANRALAVPFTYSIRWQNINVGTIYVQIDPM